MHIGAWESYFTEVIAEARELWQRRKWRYTTLAGAVLSGGIYVTAVSGATTLHTAIPSTHPYSALLSVPAPRSPNDQRNTVANGSDSAAANSQSDLSVTVNGKDVAVPKGGQLHQVMHDTNGTTSIDITNQASGDSNSSSLDIHIDSRSTSQGEGE